MTWAEDTLTVIELDGMPRRVQTGGAQSWADLCGTRPLLIASSGKEGAKCAAELRRRIDLWQERVAAAARQGVLL